MSSGRPASIKTTLRLLNEHYQSFFSVVHDARKTGHPVPMDTRGWSQIIVSVLTGVKGLERKKGADLQDGSDVKGANTWEAIDTPRFNNVIKAGTQSNRSDNMSYLDGTPFLFFVLWDVNDLELHRCRIWVVRPKVDPEFRKMCRRWYEARERGEIKSTNFQLHPPRGKNTNEIRNSYGNLSYPLLFSAVRKTTKFSLEVYNKKMLMTGLCERV